jgi:glycosyltransferase involved in cell wall biosynthesis
VIPALNEEQSIDSVVRAIPNIVDDVIVVDNGSTDRTAESARNAGATVVSQPRRGYGFACLKGIAALKERASDIVVFLDGDFSDYPEELTSLVDPIVEGRAEFVVGSRMSGKRPKGALLPQAVFGNWLATTLLRLFWSVRYTDLGPFRAISMSCLDRMHMIEGTFGWTVEMQIKAAKLGLRILELPVRYRKRVGTSKVTGTLSGTLRASYGILATIVRHACVRETP